MSAAIVGPAGVVARHGDESRRFALASVTKLLSAMAVLVAVEEGTVDLDEPAGPPGATVTHLLAHASGLGPSDRNQILASPGTRRIYSNAGFEVLADHLAAAASMPFDRYLSEAVLEPLAMHDTTVGGSAASGATSTIADLSSFAAELLWPGLVSTDTLKQATRPVFPALAGVLPGFGRQDPNPWGLGFEVRGHKRPHWTGPHNDPATFGHFGQTGTFLWVDPVARLALVVLTDRAFGPWAGELMTALSDAVLGHPAR